MTGAEPAAFEKSPNGEQVAAPAAAPVTPVRALGHVDAAGCRMLRDTASTYRDGGEQAVLALVSDADDLRSDSVEMLTASRGWAQRYHVDPARANVLRCLDLPPTARVLEIGAGCGAISRYLGEQCATVDSLEPVPIRAAAARARCRDLASVEVFVGELDDVPAEASYDVVVVIGVLEYVGAGTADRAPYLEFLSQIRARLADGGTLVLAIENRLGVKYLVGAPEDHTNRAFDSVEGYPRGGHARTFSRRELEALLRDSGLEPTTRTAFPDYKLTRAVFGEFPEPARSLMHRIPAFPSPDWRSPRPRLADERLLWRELVDAGLESECGNSFLTLATKGAGVDLWPDGQVGAFYTTDRISALNTATSIRASGDAVVLRRRALRPQAGTPARAAAGGGGDGAGGGGDGAGTGIRIVESQAAFQPGTDVTQVLADDGPDAWTRLVDPWLRLVDRALAENPVTAIDVVPHNLIVDDAGEVHLIDVELEFPGITRDRLLRRGIFWLADRVAPLAPPQRWSPARTVGELMRELGAIAGLEPDGSWIELAVSEETDFLARVRPGPPPGEADAQWRARIESRTRARVERKLADLPLGDRLPQQAERLGKELVAARADAAAARTKAQEAGAAAERSRADAARSRVDAEEARGRADDARTKAERAHAEARKAAAETARARADLAAVRRRLARSEAERRRIEGLVEVRAMRRGRQLAARLAPAGSRRRRIASRLLPPGTSRRRLIDRMRGR